MNRLESVTETVAGFPNTTVAYQYDTPGRLLWKTYGNNDTVEYRYDGESRLSGMTVKNGSTPLENYVYTRNAMGNLLSIITNGVRTDYAYDATDQLIREILPNGGGVNEWDFDTACNLLTTRLQGNSTGYLYNNDDELTEASGQTTITGTVNGGSGNNKWYNSWAECRGVRARVNTGNGNFTLPGVPIYAGTNALQVKVTDASGNTNVQTRTVTKTSGCAAQYDGNGNMTSRQTSQGTWTYTWNALNQLLTANTNGILVLQNWYDSFGRRIAKLEVIGGTTNKWLYVYDGWSVVAVLNGASGQLVESYTRGLGLAGDVGTLVAVTHHSGSVITSGTYYGHYNYRGDVNVIRNGATTAGTYEYSAFGTLKAQTGTDACRFKFSSKERDAATGFSYYGFRFYSPRLQRWLNRDPIGEEGGQNLYGFVANAPISNYDLLGLFDTGSPGMTEAVKNRATVRGDVAVLVNNMLASRNATCEKCNLIERKSFNPASATSYAFMYSTRYFILGQVSVNLAGVGYYEVDCIGKRFRKWDIGVTGSFRDKFDELIPTLGIGGVKGFGSLPLTFVGSWVESYSGSE